MKIRNESIILVEFTIDEIRALEELLGNMSRADTQEFLKKNPEMLEKINGIFRSISDWSSSK